MIEWPVDGHTQRMQCWAVKIRRWRTYNSYISIAIKNFLTLYRSDVMNLISSFMMACMDSFGLRRLLAAREFRHLLGGYMESEMIKYYSSVLNWIYFQLRIASA